MVFNQKGEKSESTELKNATTQITNCFLISFTHRLRVMDWQRATNYQRPCAHEFNAWDHFVPEEDPTAAP